MVNTSQLIDYQWGIQNDILPIQVNPFDTVHSFCKNAYGWCHDMETRFFCFTGLSRGVSAGHMWPSLWKGQQCDTSDTSN